MFIEEVIEENEYEYISKYGKKFKSSRKKLLYKLRCDVEGCRKEYLKNHTICKKEGKHFCPGCVKKYGNSLFREAGRERIKEISLAKIGLVRKGSRGYPEIYVGYDYPYITSERKARQGYWIFEHVFIMEKEIQAPIPLGYVVHHIDGDKYNSSIDNLCLCTHIEHSRCHAGVGGILLDLFNTGIIEFDRDTIQYKIREEYKCRQNQEFKVGL